MPTPVGRTTGTQASGTSFPWTRSCAVGNTIVLFIQHGVTGSSITSVTDNGGNTWTKLQSTNDLSATSQRNVDMWVCVPTVAITTITMNCSVTTSWVVAAEDFNGAYTVRDSNKYFGASHTLTAFTTAAADLLVMCVAYVATTGGTAQLVQSGWTYEGLANTGTTQQEQFKITSAAGGSMSPSITTNPTIGAVYASLYIPAPNTAPVITQPSRVQLTGPGSTTVSFNATDSDGTIASGGVSWVAGPTPAATVGPTLTQSTTGLNTGATTFSAAFTAGAGRYTFAANCVDNDGAPATQKTWIVDVPAASTADVQAENVIAAAYANVGGAASLAAACRDTLTSTYAESPGTPAGEIARATYLPYPVGDIVIDAYNYSSPASPPITVQATVYKEDGTTQVYQTSFVAPTTVPGPATPIAIDPAGMAMLTGVNDAASLVLRRALVVDFAPTQ